MSEIKSKYFFEPLQLAEQLYRLAQSSYAHGSPWTVEQFAEDLRNEQSEYLLLTEDDLIGFLGYHQVLDEIEIFNLVVAASEQKKGYGALLLKELFRLAEEDQAAQILLEVRVTNFSAQNLYLGHGFEVIARRKNYYQAPVEDALIMIKKVRPGWVK